MKEDERKWLLCSARSTPSFELEDVCDANEHCESIIRCSSQPDCLKMCFREKSPVMNSAEPVKALKPFCLSAHEWPSVVSNNQAKWSATVEGEKEASSLFCHIQDTDDAMWLMNSSPPASTVDISKSLSSLDKFKDDKEEANFWLQKAGSSNPQESASAVSVSSASSCVDFCVSDWLLVPEKHDHRQTQEFDHNKKESDC